MILAQALLRHLLGSSWRWPDAELAEGAEAAAPAGLAAVLELFWDTPAGDCCCSTGGLVVHDVWPC